MYFFLDFRSVLVFIGQLLVLFYVIFVTKNWRFFKFAWHNNGFFFPMFPFIGTMYIAVIAGQRKNVIAMADFVQKYIGFPFNLWHGYDYYYFTQDPNEAKTLLHNLGAQNKGTVYNDIAYVFQDSLLTIEYKRWRLRRKEYAKCFKPSSLKMFSLDYYKGSSDFIREIMAQNGRQSLSYDDFTKYAFKNFFLTSLGLDKQPENMHRFGECLMQFQEDVAQKLLDPLTPVSMWYYLSPGGRNTAKNMKEITSISRQIFEDKTKQRADFKAFIEHEDNPALLDLMMSLKGTLLNDKNVLDDLVFFSAAASDTSGHFLMICFTLIGMFQDVQEKIYQEIVDLVGQKPILPDDVPKLEYIEAVVHETLRLFPVIPILSRKLDKDVDLGDKVIPKGSNVGISVYHIQRNPTYWPDPLKFDPTRFLPENASKIQPNTYMAFSSGPRDCLGKAQALCMLKITIASVVRNFKVLSKHKSVEEFKVMSALSLKTTHPLDCRFVPRTAELQHGSQEEI
ncbi:unnamed protein product [Ceutorhynchus assimilis]|uniref:Cytochrome P450 n=1 Tax=Ceutorhynchus assimilis TaxID=467358 RepID=A0A9N9MFI5_9CUCU|nr:unnamed protein product [Ceutorhynchus assimilis]